METCFLSGSRNHHRHSPPRDRRHPRRQEDTCGVSALTPRLRAIQWPPNFKVSNVDKYEPKQDPGGWLAVYTTAARAAGASEDVMTAYLPIVLGQDALQWIVISICYYPQNFFIICQVTVVTWQSSPFGEFFLPLGGIFYLGG